MKLTIKDFLLLNKKCFLCNGPMKIAFEASVSSPRDRIIPLKLEGIHLNYPLYQYAGSTTLSINIVDNHFYFITTKGEDKTPESNLFFLKETPHYLTHHCYNHCYNLISDILIFNELYVEPLSINMEIMNIKHSGFKIYVTSFPKEDKEESHVAIYKDYEVPPLLIGMFPSFASWNIKTKSKLIEKIDTMLLFS